MSINSKMSPETCLASVKRKKKFWTFTEISSEMRNYLLIQKIPSPRHLQHQSICELIWPHQTTYMDNSSSFHIHGRHLFTEQFLV